MQAASLQNRQQNACLGTHYCRVERRFGARLARIYSQRPNRQNRDDKGCGRVQVAGDVKAIEVSVSLKEAERKAAGKPRLAITIHRLS